MASEGKYDSRNKLNDLTGKEWLKLTNSFWFSEVCADDKAAFDHPAPFMIRDIEKLISLFTKKGNKVLDPFVGSGTTIIASNNLGRIGYGIDLNDKYIDLCTKRLVGRENYYLFNGDSKEKVEEFENNFFDYIVTSPPYHNILKNKSSGLRKDSSKKGYRNGSRIGVEYYSDLKEDLGNQETFNDFLKLLKEIMESCFKKLKSKKYCSIIISDFTIDRKEICIQGYIVSLMEEIGFEFVGTTVLLQDHKPLYPFGYPYAYKINHHHQNIISFRKP